jgi:hypothetical protein
MILSVRERGGENGPLACDEDEEEILSPRLLRSKRALPHPGVSDILKQRPESWTSQRNSFAQSLSVYDLNEMKTDLCVAAWWTSVGRKSEELAASDLHGAMCWPCI